MINIDLESKKIWDDFREGDDKAFSLLFETYLEPLYRYGMKFAADENLVKDCIQDLFVKLHRNRKSLSASNNPKFYLLLSLKNLIIDNICRNRKITYISPQELPFIADYTYKEEDSEQEIDEEIQRKYEEVLRLLNPRQKEAIYLRFQMELSYEEISQLLEINQQSARNLIHRALSKIRKNIDFSIFISLFINTFP